MSPHSLLLSVMGLLPAAALQSVAGRGLFRCGTSTWLPRWHIPASLADPHGGIDKFMSVGCEKKYGIKGQCLWSMSGMSVPMKYGPFPSCWLDIATTVTSPGSRGRSQMLRAAGLTSHEAEPCPTLEVLPIFRLLGERDPSVVLNHSLWAFLV